MVSKNVYGFNAYNNKYLYIIYNYNYNLYIPTYYELLLEVKSN